MKSINYEEVVKGIKYIHAVRESPASNFGVDFHLHSGCELFLLLTGDVTYFVEKKLYTMNYGDLIITNNQEIHKPSFQSDKTYERLTIEFDPNLVQIFNSDKYDLLNCFYCRPLGERNKITFTPLQLDEVLGLFYNIEKLKKSPSEGNEILQLSYLLELLVYINNIFQKYTHKNELIDFPSKLSPILDYISQNLESDLSLDVLEGKFYIDRYYLSKLFKKSTGCTIHSYIMYKRISKAKKLLSENISVTETCGKCGFNDYSNFINMFKRTVGVSPGKFKNKSAGK